MLVLLSNERQTSTTPGPIAIARWFTKLPIITDDTVQQDKRQPL